jgi:glycerophosphoryl diester phosphodiesterase
MKTSIRISVIAAVAIGLTAVLCARADIEGSIPVAPQGTELFRCQVHRGGGRDTRPDNALETFLWCWGHGVAPEADARLTKDGVAIALHDATLMRVGRGIPSQLATANIKDLNWAQIRNVDTGSYLDPSYSSVRISTIDSIFAAMKDRPERLLYLDEKGAPPELIAQIARKYAVEKQIYYTSPNFSLMERWQKVVPGGLGMVWLGTWPKDNSPKSVAYADKFLDSTLDRMAAAGWKGISQVQIHIRTDLSLPDPFCPSSDCIRRAIKRLHEKGITVQAFTWTQGANKDVLRKIWSLGFDNFATDDPLVLFELLPEFGKSVNR